MIEILKKRNDATVESVHGEIKKLAVAHPIPESFV